MPARALGVQTPAGDIYVCGRDSGGGGTAWIEAGSPNSEFANKLLINTGTRCGIPSDSDKYTNNQLGVIADGVVIAGWVDIQFSIKSCTLDEDNSWSTGVYNATITVSDETITFEVPFNDEWNGDSWQPVDNLNYL